FRDAALADHWLKSEFVDAGVPVDWAPFERIVDPDDVDELEDTEEDELVRERVFRGTPNMPLTSSGFIEFPSIEPHAGRDIWGNVGGFATAVMRLDGRRRLGKAGFAADASQ